MSPDLFESDCPGALVPTSAIEEYSEAGAKRTREAAGWAFVPHRLAPDVDITALCGRVSEALVAAHSSLGEIRGLSGDLPLTRLFVAPLLQREALLSSRIENTIATAREVAEYRAGRTPTRNDPIEVDNYRRALLHGVESDLPICRRLVREMHRILCHGVRGAAQHPGEFRTSQNRIGGERDDFSSARFVPPPAGDYLDGCLDALERFWNTPPKGLDPMLAVAMAHYQFEAVHPFEDGNGRLGRALVPLSLCRLGLLNEPLVYVSGYFERHRRDYYDLLLRVSTHGEWASWCRFFLFAIADVGRDSAARLRCVRDLRHNVLNRLAESNAPGRVSQLVDALIDQPLMSVTAVKELLSVTYPTAKNYIDRLADVGFLHELTGGQYGRLWGATAVLDVVQNDMPESAG